MTFIIRFILSNVADFALFFHYLFHYIYILLPDDDEMIYLL